MNHDEEWLRKKFEKVSVVKKCPKCGSLSLTYKEGKLHCSECGFTQNVEKVK